MKSNRYFIKNHKKYLKEIYQSAGSLLKSPEIYLFGSIVEGNLVAASDIDILIITDIPKNHQLRASVETQIEEKAGLPLNHPFELHIITKEEFQIWNDIYKLNIKPLSDYLSS